MLEEDIERAIFNSPSEKTFIDKLLAKQDIDKIRELIKKPKLTRSELLELLYLISGAESKLLNYGEWDRYVLLKFFVWIREFIKIAELLYDYQDDLKKKEISGEGVNSPKYPIFEVIYAEFSKEMGKWVYTKALTTSTATVKFKITSRTKQLLHNNERLIEHNAKFLIDLYLNIGRTTLSLGATGFIEGLKNKFEIAYPQTQGSHSQDIRNPVQKYRG